MYDVSVAQLGYMSLAALSAGLLVFILSFPFLSGEREHKKRIDVVAGGRKVRNLGLDQNSTRRKQVQETLDELNAQTKSKNNFSLRQRLEQAGLTMSVQTFHIISAVSGVVTAVLIVLFGVHPAFALAGAVAGGFGLPRFFLKRMTKKRQKKFLDEFANTIDVIVRGVKSGLPLNDCLDIISTESPEPIRGEFQQVVEHQKVGVPLMECFARMGVRMPLSEVRFFSIVISIQQKTGGNLAEALGNLSEVLRGRRRLQGKVRAFSSEAKSSASIIGALPFLVLVLVYVTTPEYVSLLWTEPMGRIMMFGSAIWMSMGIFIMKKMINFDY